MCEKANTRFRKLSHTKHAALVAFPNTCTQAKNQKIVEKYAAADVLLTIPGGSGAARVDGTTSKS
jgi:hypothetical protein